jgi:hypothetical protein
MNKRNEQKKHEIILRTSPSLFKQLILMLFIFGGKIPYRQKINIFAKSFDWRTRIGYAQLIGSKPQMFIH